MKRLLLLSAIIVLISSCEKDSSFISKYETIPGTWEIQSISYDSSGVRITKVLPYKKLIIEENLNYEIYTESDELIEKGSIEIISQTIDYLELYFAAKRPSYSCMAGSYVFGVTSVELVSLSENELKFRTINASYDIYSEREIYLIR